MNTCESCLFLYITNKYTKSTCCNVLLKEMQSDAAVCKHYLNKCSINKYMASMPALLIDRMTNENSIQ